MSSTGRMGRMRGRIAAAAGAAAAVPAMRPMRARMIRNKVRAVDVDVRWHRVRCAGTLSRRRVGDGGGGGSLDGHKSRGCRSFAFRVVGWSAPQSDGTERRAATKTKRTKAFPRPFSTSFEPAFGASPRRHPAAVSLAISSRPENHALFSAPHYYPASFFHDVVVPEVSPGFANSAVRFTESRLAMMYNICMIRSPAPLRSRVIDDR